VNYEEATYEGYGPNGVAVIVSCLTDNKNRTAGEVRSLFTKAGGNMGDTGSVGWMFERRGVIDVKPGPSENDVMETALDAGALDVLPHEGGFEIRTEPNDLHKVMTVIEAKKWALEQSKLTWIPKEPMQLDFDAAVKVLKLVDLFEDNDDVQNVYGGFEISDEVAAKLAEI
jgi:YebC/PmpR family DNA-binding regulatory protein